MSSRPLKGAVGRIGFSEMSADASGALQRVASADRSISFKAEGRSYAGTIAFSLTDKVPGISVSKLEDVGYLSIILHSVHASGAVST